MRKMFSRGTKTALSDRSRWSVGSGIAGVVRHRLGGAAAWPAVGPAEVDLARVRWVSADPRLFRVRDADCAWSLRVVCACPVFGRRTVVRRFKSESAAREEHAIIIAKCVKLWRYSDQLGEDILKQPW